MEFEIGKYFEEDTATYKEKGVSIYHFKDELIDEFVKEFLLPFRQAYISDEDLNDGVENEVWTDKAEAIAEQIPTLPNLQSGEFSEILLYFLSLCFRCPEANVIPLKWRWKENQNTPCHLSDIVLMKCMDDENPSENDFMYVVESKGKALAPSKNFKTSVMNDAIDGSSKDYVSRSGKMVAYMRKWYNREKNYDMARKVKRFGDSVDVDYQKFYNAAIVVERDTLTTHLDNIKEDKLKEAKKNGISLIAVPIRSMKAMYERMYSEVVNT